MIHCPKKRSLIPAAGLILLLILVLGNPASARTIYMQGHVYEGISPDISDPATGVRVAIWGSDSPNSYTPSQSGSYQGEYYTYSDGYYFITIHYDDEFVPWDYYHLVVFAPSGYTVVSNSPDEGTPILNSWISLPITGSDYQGGDFWIVPNTAPTASFTYSPTSTQKAPATIWFTDTSTGYPTGWYWDFGDGSTSTLQNPSRTYQNPGTYTIRLTPSNSFGSSSPSARVIYIDGNPPVADFTLSNTSGYAPLPVRITDTSTGNPTSWSWTFTGPIGAGPGPINQQYLPVYVLGTKSVVTVTLTVANAYGSSSKTKSITVNDPPNTVSLPVADFTLSNTSGHAPLLVQITDTSTGNPTSWSWTFTGPVGAGPGPINQRYLPLYGLDSPGTVTVTLTVANAYGSDSETKTIIVTGSDADNTPPVAEFTYRASGNYEAPATIEFTDLSTNNPTAWQWRFDDGSYSYEQDPDHTFLTNRYYSVQLVASNQFGNSATSQTIYIGPATATMSAYFTADAYSGTAPLTVRFTDASTGSPVRWEWDFDGDGHNDSSESDPEYTYSSAGSYTVRLTVYDQDGRSDTIERPGLILVKKQEDTPVFIPYWIIGGLVVAGGGYIVWRALRPRQPERVVRDNISKKPDSDLSRPDNPPGPEAGLDVRGGIDVKGMHCSHGSIELCVEAGVECPGEKGGK